MFGHGKVAKDNLREDSSGILVDSSRAGFDLSLKEKRSTLDFYIELREVRIKCVKMIFHLCFGELHKQTCRSQLPC